MSNSRTKATVLASEGLLCNSSSTDRPIVAKIANYCCLVRKILVFSVAFSFARAVERGGEKTELYQQSSWSDSLGRGRKYSLANLCGICSSEQP